MLSYANWPPNVGSFVAGGPQWSSMATLIVKVGTAGRALSKGLWRMALDGFELRVLMDALPQIPVAGFIGMVLVASRCGLARRLFHIHSE